MASDRAGQRWLSLGRGQALTTKDTGTSLGHRNVFISIVEVAAEMCTFVRTCQTVQSILHPVNFIKNPREAERRCKGPGEGDVHPGICLGRETGVVADCASLGSSFRLLTEFCLCLPKRLHAFTGISPWFPSLRKEPSHAILSLPATTPTPRPNTVIPSAELPGGALT